MLYAETHVQYDVGHIFAQNKQVCLKMKIPVAYINKT